MRERPSFESVVTTTGFLTDAQIRAALEADHLIEPRTWNAEQIRHASYTVRLGHRVEIERSTDGASTARQRISLNLTRGQELELRPGDTALLYSMENVRLPPSVLGFTVARGLLVVETLVPENTYVDPGFSGQIYTTVTNLSGRILKIPYGAPIARLFLFKLAEPVAHPYESGPSKGIAQHLDSEPASPFGTLVAAQKATSAQLLADVAKERGGPRISELLRRQRVLSITAIALAVVSPLFLQWGLTSEWGKQVGPFMLSVLSNLVAAPLVYYAARLWTHRER
jgi:deoxycytidine triphosphate deaminase